MHLFVLATCQRVEYTTVVLRIYLFMYVFAWSLYAVFGWLVFWRRWWRSNSALPGHANQKRVTQINVAIASGHGSNVCPYLVFLQMCHPSSREEPSIVWNSSTIVKYIDTAIATSTHKPVDRRSGTASRPWLPSVAFVLLRLHRRRGEQHISCKYASHERCASRPQSWSSWPPH